MAFVGGESDGDSGSKRRYIKYKRTHAHTHAHTHCMHTYTHIYTHAHTHTHTWGDGVGASEVEKLIGIQTTSKGGQKIS